MAKKKISLAARARAAGIDARVVHLRVNRYGWSIKKALTTPVNDHRAKSFSAQAREAGVAPNVAFARIRAGWSKAEAISFPVGNGGPVRDAAPTISAQARAAGLPITTVYRRLRRGWSLTRALSDPRIDPNKVYSRTPAQRRHRLYIRKCVEVASTLLGLRVSRSVAMRLLRDLRTAGVISMEVDPKCISVQARKAGLSPQRVHNRLCQGWSLKRALQTPIRDRTSTLAFRARQAGLNPRMVWRRVHLRGWSEERALATPPLN